MVKESITHQGLVNVSRFWIRYLKCPIRPVFVLTFLKIFVELEYIIHKPVLEYLDVCLVPFSFYKLFPRP